jgi:uncharacterized protein YbcI
VADLQPQLACSRTDPSLIESNSNPRLRIANEIVHLHSEYYGRGPSKAKTYIQDDLVVVVLEETFTLAERTLIDRGEADSIHDIRRRFQQVMGDQFKAVVEEATGRPVRAFMSETHVAEDVAIEVFLLGDAPSSDGASGDGKPPS